MPSKTATGNAYIGYDLEPIINGVDFEDKLVEFKITEKLDQVPEFELELVDVSTSDVNVVRGNYFVIRSGSTYVTPKFEIGNVDKSTDLFVKLEGYAWAESKLNNYLVKKTASCDSESQTGRPQYTAVPVNTIVAEQLAAYTTGVSAGTVLSTALTIRSEGDKFINFFAGMADVLDTDWYGSYSANLATSYINITTRGTDKSGSIIIAVSGANQNAEVTSRESDYDSLRNELTVYGYGDGINQLESKSFHSTRTRSYLSSAMTATQTTAVLADASLFPVSGSVWIGCEKCTYTGKAGNTLTGLTRGVAFQGNVSKAYAHKVESPAYDAQWTETAPQSSGGGSSIFINGRRQDSYTFREIIDQSTLDIVAEKMMLERKGV
jgi:hypothetical protein